MLRHGLAGAALFNFIRRGAIHWALSLLRTAAANIGRLLCQAWKNG